MTQVEMIRVLVQDIRRVTPEILRVLLFDEGKRNPLSLYPVIAYLPPDKADEVEDFNHAFMSLGMAAVSTNDPNLKYWTQMEWITINYGVERMKYLNWEPMFMNPTEEEVEGMERKMHSHSRFRSGGGI